MAYLNGKKGQSFLAVVLVFIIIVVLGVVFLAINSVQGDINDFIQEDDQLDNRSKAIMADTTTSLPQILDMVALIFFIGFWIVSMITAYLSGEHPILALVSIGSLVLIAFSVMVISNFYDDFTQDELMEESSQDFPFLDFLLNNYLMAFLAVGLTVGIAFVVRGGGGV